MRNIEDLYKDGAVHLKMMTKILETRDQYYTDIDGVVRIKFNDQWVPYLDVMTLDPRLQDDLITSKVSRFYSMEEKQ